MIHIEGMGLLGSLLADELAHAGRDFTWNDTEVSAVAWPVSTGLAYPDGDSHNAAGLQRWRDRLALGRLTDFAREVPYWFAHKNPPHGGKYPFTDHGRLRRATPSAVSVDVPSLVRGARTRFADRRLALAPTGATVVVAHTTTERGDGYLWGWAVPVELTGAPEPHAALYAKKHRFNLTYAYPIGPSGQHWAGSVLRYQHQPRVVPEHALVALFTQWAADAHTLLGVDVAYTGTPGQGWRPRAKGGDNGRPEWIGGRLVLPPMATDGVRNGLTVIDQAMAML